MAGLAAIITSGCVAVISQEPGTGTVAIGTVATGTVGNWNGGRHWRQNRGRYYGGGNYGRYYGGGYYGRYYDDDDDGAAALLGLGLGFGLGSLYQGYYNQGYYNQGYYNRGYYNNGYYSSAHVRWCYNRYRSYRTWDNTFQPYNGPRRQCWSPYR